MDLSTLLILIETQDQIFENTLLKHKKTFYSAFRSGCSIINWYQYTRAICYYKNKIGNLVWWSSIEQEFYEEFDDLLVQMNIYKIGFDKFWEVYYLRLTSFLNHHYKGLL